MIIAEPWRPGLDLEQLDDERVAGLGAAHEDRARRGVDALEVERREEIRLGRDLPGEAVVRLERDDLAGIDLEHRRQVGRERPDRRRRGPMPVGCISRRRRRARRARAKHRYRERRAATAVATAAITSGSRREPARLRSGPSPRPRARARARRRTGRTRREASDRAREVVTVLLRAFSIAIRTASTRLIWPAPIPIVCRPLASTIAFDETCLQTRHAKSRSAHWSRVGLSADDAHCFAGRRCRGRAPARSRPPSTRFRSRSPGVSDAPLRVGEDAQRAASRRRARLPAPSSYAGRVQDLDEVLRDPAAELGADRPVENRDAAEGRHGIGSERALPRLLDRVGDGRPARAPGYPGRPRRDRLPPDDWLKPFEIPHSRPPRLQRLSSWSASRPNPSRGPDQPRSSARITIWSASTRTLRARTPAQCSANTGSSRTAPSSQNP